MKPERKKTKIIITFLVGLAVMLGVLLMRDFFSLTDPSQAFGALCDACFVPGVLIMGIGALLFVADDGLFDIFAFGMQKVLALSVRKGRKGMTPRTFHDYRVIKQGRRKSGFGFLLVTGGVYLIAAVVFLLLSEGM